MRVAVMSSLILQVRRLFITMSSTLSTNLTVTDQKFRLYPYSSDFDPAVQPSVYSYSRLLEDLSTVLITYNSRNSTPFVCLASAAEDETLCARYPTPNHLSETFVRRGVTSSDFGRKVLSGDRAAELVVSGGVASHKDVIIEMLSLWNRRQLMNDRDQQLFGRFSYMWQEILNRIQGYDSFTSLAFWPTG